MTDTEDKELFKDDAEITAINKGEQETEKEKPEPEDDEDESEDDEVEGEDGDESETPADEEDEGDEDEDSEDADNEEETNSKSQTVPLAALQSERQKRQALEEEVTKLRGSTTPDREKDPVGYERHIRVEVSKSMMRETHEDYDEMIEHFVKMAKTTPELENAVANHAMPAKLAYDIAKEDLEITRLKEVSGSDDWKQFQKWQKAQRKAEKSSDKSSDRNKTALTMPNLNKATSVKRSASKTGDDDVFAGAHF